MSDNSNSIFDTEKTWLQRDFGLDSRLIKALAKLSYQYPTKVQSKTIPIALQGKDILVRARTGSGKTVAFGLPLLQRVLQRKATLEQDGDDDETGNNVSCIVLAPTRELVKQIEKNLADLSFYCRDSVSLCSLLDDNAKVISYRLQARPDVLISTPAKLAQLLAKRTPGSAAPGLPDLSSVSLLVIDEADLILSYGYKQDVQTILESMPKIFQGIFLSATLSADLEKFKKLVLHKPVLLRLESDGLGSSDNQDGGSNILQFFLESTEEDKFLILYVFLKLGLLSGKGLIFVNDINKCYQLKLFLQQFYIQAAVLNAQVPLNSRVNIMEEFNRGVFDLLIATDASIDHGEEDDDSDDDDSDDDNEVAQNASEDDDEDDDEDDEEGSEKEEDDSEAEVDSDLEAQAAEEAEAELEEFQKAQEAASTSTPAAKVQSQASAADQQEEYGVSRGIDFQGVNFVVNFDFPQTTAAYTHRIGRTARGASTGTSLSFVTRAPQRAPEKLKQISRRDYEVLTDVRERQPRLGVVEGDNVLATIGAVSDSLGADEDDEARKQPAPLQFNFQELDGFRYRVEDTLRRITRSAIKEFRTGEIKREILNSEKLKTYFAENPNDLKILRHDKIVSNPIRAKPNLAFLPDYLIPASMRSLVQTQNGKKRKRGHKKSSQDSRVKKSKLNDPLYAGKESGEASNGPQTAPDATLSSSKPLKSGRKEWKEKHKKGEFNPKIRSKNSKGVAGSFHKAKR